MGRYGKGMRDCCDSPAQAGQNHIPGCVFVSDMLEQMARDNGWIVGTFGPHKVQKWYNPQKDDGSRYCVDSPNSLRYICEDHDLILE